MILLIAREVMLLYLKSRVAGLVWALLTVKTHNWNLYYILMDVFILEESCNVGLPLGIEYEKKKQRLRHELRMDYRHYMVQVTVKLLLLLFN